jgi:hypothetical protein
MSLWFGIVFTLLVFGCAPQRSQPGVQTGVSPAHPSGSKRIARDGEGGFILPDGTRVAADEKGGFRLPNGGYVAALADGLLLPNDV